MRRPGTTQRVRTLKAALPALLLVTATSPASGAEPYPVRPVRVIVPFAPGGTLDLTARVTSLQLSEQLGRSFVVDNRSGGTGIIGYGLVAKAAPDGYTLTLIDTGFAIVPSVRKSLPYDSVRDFTPITQIIGVPRALVVHPSIKAGTLKEFVALAQASPGKLNYGSGGAGGINHLSCILFNRAAKVDIAHIPYKGCGGALNDVMGNQVGSAFVTASSTLPFIESGKVRALAVTSAERSPLLPDVPSVAELGYPGYELNQWHGLLAPAGTPEAVVQQLHEAVEKIIARDDVKAKLTSLGYTVAHDGPAEFQAMINADIDRFQELAQKIGLKIN